MDESKADEMVRAVIDCVGHRGHVIWDWNGTLLDDVDHAIDVMNGLLQDQSLPLLDRARYRELFDFPVRRYYDALGFDYAQETFETLCNRFVDRFMLGVTELPVFPHMQAAVAQLHAGGATQSILSATEQESLEALIVSFGLRDTFELVFGIDNRFAVSKVERGRELLQVSGVDSSRTVLVGDTLHDLAVASELDTHLILVEHGHHSPVRLRAAKLASASRRLYVLSA